MNRESISFSEQTLLIPIEIRFSTRADFIISTIKIFWSYTKYVNADIGVVKMFSDKTPKPLLSSQVRRLYFWDSA